MIGFIALLIANGLAWFIVGWNGKMLLTVLRERKHWMTRPRKLK